MFRYAPLKLSPLNLGQIGRKVLILCVMSAGLFALSYTARVDATPCCDACLATAESCIEYCHGLGSDPAEGECLIGCGANYDLCSHACGNGIPVCIAI